MQYRALDLKLNDIRFIKNIENAHILININKIRINIVIDNQKKEIIFTNIFFISNLPLNLIFQKQLMRNNILMKFVQNDIEFDNRDIIT